MSPNPAQDAVIRALLAAARADLAVAGRTEQEATLDDACRVAGYAPTPTAWDGYARRFLPWYGAAAGESGDKGRTAPIPLTDAQRAALNRAYMYERQAARARHLSAIAAREDDPHCAALLAELAWRMDDLRGDHRPTTPA